MGQEAWDSYEAAGTCAFKTCSRSMLIPVSYLIKLLESVYEGSDAEPRNEEAAVHHAFAEDARPRRLCRAQRSVLYGVRSPFLCEAVFLALSPRTDR